MPRPAKTVQLKHSQSKLLLKIRTISVCRPRLAGSISFAKFRETPEGFAEPRKRRVPLEVIEPLLAIVVQPLISVVFPEIARFLAILFVIRRSVAPATQETVLAPFRPFPLLDLFLFDEQADSPQRFQLAAVVVLQCL